MSPHQRTRSTLRLSWNCDQVRFENHYQSFFFVWWITDVSLPHRTEIPNVKLYFSVDGTKPDPFQIFHTGHVSTYLYRGAFRLGPGRRVVKATAVTRWVSSYALNDLWSPLFSSDGIRESNVTTKYFDVNDMYTDNYPEYLDGYSDPEQSFDRLELVGSPRLRLKSAHSVA